MIAARWIPWVRTFAPLLAGATGMPWGRFMLANVVGALCWGPTLLLAGYLAASVPWVEHATVAVAVTAVAVATVVGAVRWWRAGRASRVEPTEPTEPTERAEPTEPTERAEPTEAPNRGR